MKTKFILHGCYTREKNESNQSYFAEMASDVPEGGTFLVVYFANEEGDEGEKFREETEQIRSAAGGKDFNTVMATEDNFIEEVKSADVVYIRGGNTQKLMQTLSRYSDLAEVIAGKTVSGSSAGAYVLSTYYFTSSKSKVLEGFGFVPARVFCHFESKRHPQSVDLDPVEELNKFDNSLELILLRDYDWVVREV